MLDGRFPRPVTTHIYGRTDSEGMGFPRSSLLIVSLVVVMVALTAVHVTSDDDGEKNKDYVIISSGDTHGMVGEDGTLGFSTVKVLADQYQAKGYPVFKVDVGDFMGGNSYLYITNGQYATEPMEQVGYDLCTLGNHEFDYGFIALSRAIEGMSTKVICSNLFHNDGTPAVDQYAVVEKKGVRIGFFALLTPQLNDYVPEGLTGDLIIEDPIDSAKKMVAILKEKDVDAIVLLSHLGIGKGFYHGSDIVCSQVEGIDVCINGHSHTAMDNGEFINDSRPLIHSNTQMADVGWKSNYVGITTRISGQYEATLYKGEPLYDESVVKVVKEYRAIADQYGNRVLAVSETELTGYADTGPGKENELGNLCMNYLMKYDVDLALMPINNFAKGLGVGDITLYEALDAMPYDGEIYTFSVTGQELWDAVVATLTDPLMSDKLPAFSDNVCVRHGNGVPTGITIDGVEIEPDATYTAVTSSFMFNRVMHLPQDRILEINGMLRELLLDMFEVYPIITEDDVGGNRYIEDA